MDRSTVLVVEDEPLVLIAAAEALRDAGFNVIEAATADEAALLLRAAGHEVSVVFTDIEMPGAMDGMTLARVVRGAWPAISVLITSGRVKPGESELPMGTAFVAKPYDLRHLANVVVQLTAR